jgi:hypothetical protein
MLGLDPSEPSGSIKPQTFELSLDDRVVRHFWNRVPSRLTVDGSGIRIYYGPSKSRALLWNSPNLQFALLDFRESMHNRPPWVRRPKTFEFRYRPELGLSAVPIPEDAYRALAEAARSAGLIQGPSTVGGGIPAGTKVSHFARRPPRWWSRIKGGPIS